MKSLPSPPIYVYITAKAVLILLGEKISVSDSDEKVWKKAVPLMNNVTKFLDTIIAFKAEEIE